MTTKEWLCRDCESVWPSQLSLEKHKRHKHKPHQCPHCSNKFATLDRVDCHILRMHPDGGRTYDCGICGTQYKWSSGMRRCFTKFNQYGGPVNKCSMFFEEVITPIWWWRWSLIAIGDAQWNVLIRRKGIFWLIKMAIIKIKYLQFMVSYIIS